MNHFKNIQARVKALEKRSGLDRSDAGLVVRDLAAEVGTIARLMAERRDAEELHAERCGEILQDLEEKVMSKLPLRGAGILPATDDEDVAKLTAKVAAAVRKDPTLTELNTATLHPIVELKRFVAGCLRAVSRMRDVEPELLFDAAGQIGEDIAAERIEREQRLQQQIARAQCPNSPGGRNITMAEIAPVTIEAGEMVALLTDAKVVAVAKVA